MQARIIITIVALVVVVGGGIWWWQTSQAPAAPTPVAIEPRAPEEPTTEDGEVPSTPGVQRVVLPTLDASDGYVREEVSLLAPQMSEWLKQDDLVRRFAVIVDNARAGEYPRKQLAFLTQAAKFPALQSGDRLIADPDGYHRFDAFVDIAISADPERAANLLRALSPLLVQAFSELGLKDPDPVVLMRSGIDQALATPTIEGDIELVQPKVYYLYADPKLEALPALQKQLLRMGSQNLARIKTYLTQLKGYL
ncbi:MAG: DUF3014 domain-containing protein [Proteobacteria bacterium]|nr:DUF3014 domain-containing protein [Pseudomonadota bacterium]